jgi:serine/threonine-protein kinase
VQIKKISKRKAVVTAVIVLFSLTFIYLLFDWTMSALVHSRKEVMVPDLRGKTVDDSMSLLSSLNLGLKKEGEEFDQSLPPGTVVRQNPAAGIMVREGKIIKVAISQGGKIIYVPDVVGQAARSAEITLRSYGLTLGEESSRYSLVQGKDHVLSQDPTAGSTAEKDALVNLVISAGPPPENIKLMPSLTGKSIDEARRWADQNRISVDTREEKSVGVAPGMVVSQDVPPDTDLASVRRVNLVIASADSAAEMPSRTFYYEIPQSGEARAIRLVIIDENGEKELFRGTKEPGSKLEVPVNPKGRARVRIFVNNILVEEREVK